MASRMQGPLKGRSSRWVPQLVQSEAETILNLSAFIQPKQLEQLLPEGQGHSRRFRLGCRGRGRDGSGLQCKLHRAHLGVLCRGEALHLPAAGKTVQQAVQLGSVRLNLFDTAGVRDVGEHGDAVEAEGIRRSWKKLEEAGLVLAVFDLAAPLNEEDLEIARRCQGRPALAILNKQDLAGQGEAFTAAQQQLAPYFKAIIPLTARDAASLQPLCQAVAQLLGTANLDPNAAALCSARQLSAAKEARDALAEALNSQEDGFGLDAAGVCISDAQRALARLTGEDATEATIDEVFSTFCVGK